MNDMGMLDDMPIEVREEGGLYQIVYDNPLATRARRARRAPSTRCCTGLAPLMQLDPQQRSRPSSANSRSSACSAGCRHPRRAGELPRDRRREGGQ
jgi:hypothetical protein